MMKKNNSGMSFIEIIVAVLIVGILAGSVILNVGIINSPKAMDCAKRISTALDKTRLETMSKMDKEVVAALFKEDGKYFISITEAGETPSSKDAQAIMAGDGSLEISIKKSQNEAAKIVDETPVIIRFDKASGAFQNTDGLFAYDAAEINIKGSKEVKVVLVQRTGRNYIE